MPPWRAERSDGPLIITVRDRVHDGFGEPGGAGRVEEQGEEQLQPEPPAPGALSYHIRPERRALVEGAGALSLAELPVHEVISPVPRPRRASGGLYFRRSAAPCRRSDRRVYTAEGVAAARTGFRPTASADRDQLRSRTARSHGRGRH